MKKQLLFSTSLLIIGIGVVSLLANRQSYTSRPPGLELGRVSASKCTDDAKRDFDKCSFGKKLEKCKLGGLSCKIDQEFLVCLYTYIDSLEKCAKGKDDDFGPGGLE